MLVTCLLHLLASNSWLKMIKWRFSSVLSVLSYYQKRFGIDRTRIWLFFRATTKSESFRNSQNQSQQMIATRMRQASITKFHANKFEPRFDFPNCQVFQFLKLTKNPKLLAWLTFWPLLLALIFHLALKRHLMADLVDLMP